MNSDHIHYSKYLCLILRHSPEVIGVSLDEHGWCNIEELLIGMDITQSELFEIVRTDDKNRYTISEDKMMIRANQGHSIDIDLELEAIPPPMMLHHGTPYRSVESIMATGLNKGERQYVHLSTNRKTAAIVGARRGSSVVLDIDAGRMWRNGHLFYLSKNGVWLCGFVPAEYITVDKY